MSSALTALLDEPLTRDAPAEQVIAEASRRARAGVAVASISARDVGDEILHDVVWTASSAPQRFELSLPAARLAAVLVRHAREGFHAAGLALTGGPDDLRVAVVLEPSPREGPPPRVIGPMPFRDGAGRFFLGRADDLDGMVVRAVSAAGAPRGDDGRDVLACAVLWPQPRTRITWAVHLDACEAGSGQWVERMETRALGGVARPVQLQVLGAGATRLVLSLWHDTRMKPWPSPDPLAAVTPACVDEGIAVARLAETLATRVGVERRALLSVSALGGAEAERILLFGEPDRDAPLPRRRAVRHDVLAIGGDAGAITTADAPDAPAAEPSGEATHPLDAWMWNHMATTGSRHAQLVVVRGLALVHAAAYTLAEEGYPVASLHDAMRVGSVTKLVTALATLAAVFGSSGDASSSEVDLDRRALQVMGVDAASRAPRLSSVTLRHLLAHDAGLPSFPELRPDDPANPLSDAGVARAAGREDHARPGDLVQAVLAALDDGILTRAPGGAGAALAYSNEGYVWLGELVGLLHAGDPAGFERALRDLVWSPAKVEPGSRGSLGARDPAASRARGESPPHPLTPTWRRVTRDDGTTDVALTTRADNLPFLGGAAGLVVPLLWLARLGRALVDPAVQVAPFRAGDRERLAAPVAPGTRRGHGVFLGDTAWWTYRGREGLPVSTRVVRMHHNGRVDGGTSLLVQQTPLDPADLDAALTIVVAENQLGALYEKPHGRELLAILRNLETRSAGLAGDLWNPSPPDAF